MPPRVWLRESKIFKMGNMLFNPASIIVWTLCLVLALSHREAVASEPAKPEGSLRVLANRKYRPYMFFGKLGNETAQVVASYVNDQTSPGCLVISLSREKTECVFPVTVSHGQGEAHTMESIAIESSSANVVASGRWYVLVDDQVIATGMLRQSWGYFHQFIRQRNIKLINALVLQEKANANEKSAFDKSSPSKSATK
jgi:hypothetical protein